jgi:hypothetical protein
MVNPKISQKQLEAMHWKLIAEAQGDLIKCSRDSCMADRPVISVAAGDTKLSA